MWVAFLRQQMNRFVNLDDSPPPPKKRKELLIVTIHLIILLKILLHPRDVMVSHVLLQSVATFFSHVMAAIGGNTAGPGMLIFYFNFPS